MPVFGEKAQLNLFSKFSIGKNNFFAPRLLSSQGFTLIELLVVIAILGILSFVLTTTINPLDKINAANDARAISTITQLGKAMDSCETFHDDAKPSPAGNSFFPDSICDLNTVEEVKFTTIAAINNYTFYYFVTPATCKNNKSVKCTGYLFGIGTLASKKFIAKPYFVYTNGKGCYIGNIPSLSSIGATSCP